MQATTTEHHHTHRTKLLFAALAWVLSLAVPAGAVSAIFIGVGSLAVSRVSFSLVPLTDGRILAVGASPFDNRVELYDPQSRVFSTTGNLVIGRSAPTATRLVTGNVLVAGGTDTSFSATATAEIYDPQTSTFSLTADMTVPRSNHTATPLEDGRVLIVGGHRFNFPNSALVSAEVYDPWTGLFTAVGSMTNARQDHTATLLADGHVLVAGGFGTDQTGVVSAELFDPTNGTFSPAGTLQSGRGEHTATRLINGLVLIAGGYSAFPGPARATAELYDPVTGTFSFTGNMTAARGSQTASMLSDGRVLIAGGFAEFPLAPALQTADVYDLTSGSFVADASMAEARGRHAGVVLPGGDVLVAGGMNASGSSVLSAELYQHDGDANSQLAELRAVIANMNLGTLGTSLIDKLRKAQQFNEQEKLKQACDNLASFLNQVSAQSGKGLTIAQASTLTEIATRIRNVIGC